MPSLPASGEVLTPNVMRSTGSSTLRRGSGSGSSGSASVSPISTSGKPATTNRSPATQLVDLDAADRRRTPSSWRELALERRLRPRRPPRRAARRSRRARSVPSHDPADGEPAEVVGRVEVGDERLQRRVGIARRARGSCSSDARRAAAARSASAAGHADADASARPSRATAEMTGNSMWWSAASRSRNSW